MTGLRTIRAAGWQQVMRDRNAEIASVSQSPWILELAAGNIWELAIGLVRSTTRRPC